MAERSVTVRLKANITDFKARMAEAERAVDRYGKNADGTAARADTALGRMAQSARNNRAAWDQAGSTLVGFGVATTAALAGSVKAAMDWESQFAGVKKTTDVSGLSAAQAEKAFAGLEAGLRGMARTLPASQEEIAGVAEAAGQLGVKRDAVLGFTRVMIDLGETTNLTAEEAATSLARISNIMGTSAGDIGRMGSTIVELGNNSATTEAEIVELGTRLAAAGRQAGLSEADVFGFASTLTSVGVEAEAGGTALSKVFTSINDAVIDGSDKLDTFAEVAGVSSQEFQRAYGQDAAGAIAMFVEGLGRVSASGESTTQVFEDLELTDQRLMRALLSTGQAGSLLADQLGLANEGWSENTALLDEAGRRYDTTAAKMEIAKNNVREAAISFGEVLLPAVASAAEGVAGFASGIADLPGPVKAVGAGLGTAAGAAGLLGGAFLLTFPRVMDTVSAFRDLRDVSPGVASGLGKVGKAAGAAAAVFALGVAADQLGRSLAPAQQGVEATTRALLDMEDASWGLDTLFSDNSDSVDTFVGALDRLDGTDVVEGFFDKVTGAVGLTSRTLREARDDFESVDRALVNMVNAGNPELAAEQFAVMARRGQEAGFTLEEIQAAVPGYQESLVGLENQQRLAGGAADVMNKSLKGVPGAADGAVEGAGMAGDAAAGMGDQISDTIADLEEWQDAMASTVESFVDPLDVYDGLLDKKMKKEQAAAQKVADTTGDATDSWEDHVGDVDVSLDEYAAALEKQNKAQERWRGNLVRITDRGGVEVARILADMGAEGAQLTDKMARATGADFERMKDALISDARFGRRGVVSEIAIMERLGRAGAKDTAQGIARELGVGVDEVARIARQYGVKLAEGVNPVLRGVGKATIVLSDGSFRTRSGAVGRAAGGVLPGWSPGYDDQDYYSARGDRLSLSGGEAIMRPEWTSMVGEDWIRRANSAARSGKVLPVPGAEVSDEAFADGGTLPKPPAPGRSNPPVSTGASAAMDHAYDAANEFVEANSMMGAAGIGSAGGAGGRGWQWQMAVLRRVFPGLPLNSGYRPGAITALGNRSMHGMGRAVDVPPRPEVFNWIKANYGASTKQLFFSPLGAILNGRPWNMDPTTRAGHYDHIHWGYKDGGVFAPGSVLNPHVRDQGGPLLPGFTFNGTGRAETVVPGAVGGSVGGGSRTYHFEVKSERTWTEAEALQLVARAESMYMIGV